MRFNPLFVRVLGVVLVGAVGIGLMYLINKPNRKLPIFNPSSINGLLVDSSLKNVSSGHRIGDFSLINQNGENVTSAKVRGKVYVADFFFTTCKTICPKMTNQLRRVQEAFEDRVDFAILSHSVTPEIDSVAQLMSYAEMHNVNPEIWQLLTGSKDQIYDLARKSYFAAKIELLDEFEEFVHTENFVLIDKQKRIRGYYNGISTKDVDRLIEEIEILLEEEI